MTIAKKNRRARRRLPAWGKALKGARDAGNHPARVWVLVGDDWSRLPEDAPSVAVRASEWAAGAIDWSVLAGVRADVVDRDGMETVYPVAAEVAEHAAPVFIHTRAGPDDWPHAEGDAISIDIDDAAQARRACDEIYGALRWPAWWTSRLRWEYRLRRDHADNAFRFAAVCKAVADNEILPVEEFRAGVAAGTIDWQPLYDELIAGHHGR